MTDGTPGEAIDVVLVVGGKYHDFDFARLELLKLLAEHEEFPRPCQPDYEDTTPIRPIPGPHPGQLHVRCSAVTAAQQPIRDWVEPAAGGWHCTARARRSSTAGGWAAPRDVPMWSDTLGSQFIAHPPIAPYASTTSHPTTGWSQASRPSRPPTSCTSASTRTGRRSLPCCRRRIEEAHGVSSKRLDRHRSRPPRDVPPAAGGRRRAVQHAGHCRGHYDMVPAKPYYPNVDRCSWELPVFYELLRRSLRWARGERS